MERLASGLNWAEGPAWFGGTRALLCSDVQNSRITRWDEEAGQTTVFRKPANHSNGLARDKQGRLVVCEHSTRRVVRTGHDGGTTVLMDGFEGEPLNSPNDIVCKSDGSIWFTDPAFGPNPFGGMARPELPGNAYRIDPEARRAARVVEDVRGPSGLGFSPDEKVLYVVEARAAPNRLILACDVAADGTTVGNARVRHDCGRGTADGFKADVDGNIWCGWGVSEELDGVAVLAPDGKMIGHVRLPERCANVASGGANRNRLFMASARSIYALCVNTRGHARRLTGPARGRGACAAPRPFGAAGPWRVRRRKTAPAMVGVAGCGHGAGARCGARRWNWPRRSQPDGQLADRAPKASGCWLPVPGAAPTEVAK